MAPANGQAVFAYTDRLGVYKVEIDRPTQPPTARAVAVNLMNPAESRVEPRKQLPIFQTGGRAVAASGERSGRSEFWRWLAAIAFALLIVEWLVYQRPALALLRERWRRRRVPPPTGRAS
jgi:hypothetical protein